MTMAMHINAGIMVWLGIDFWQSNIFGLRRTDCFVALYCVVCIVSSAKLQWRTWRYVAAHNVSVLRVVRVALPFLSFLALAIVYCVYNPLLLTRHKWDESRLLFFLLTILFGYITSRLIVHRVLRETALAFYPIVLPLALATLYSVVTAHFPGVLPQVDPHSILKYVCASGDVRLFECVWSDMSMLGFAVSQFILSIFAHAFVCLCVCVSYLCA